MGSLRLLFANPSCRASSHSAFSTTESLCSCEIPCTRTSCLISEPPRIGGRVAAYRVLPNQTATTRIHAWSVEFHREQGATARDWPSVTATPGKKRDKKGRSWRRHGER